MDSGGFHLYSKYVVHFLVHSNIDLSSKLLSHSACISFWITKRQAISTDTSFETKIMVKSGAIEIIFKSHEPFQSYLPTGQADSAKKACLLSIQNEIQALHCAKWCLI